MARGLADRSLTALFVLLALALAFGRPLGLVLACLTVGALIQVVRLPGPVSHPPDGLHPVALIGVPTTQWRRVGGAWWSRLRVGAYRQQDRVSTWRSIVSVYAPGGSRPPAGARMRLRGYLRRSAGYSNQPARPTGPWRLSLKSLTFLHVVAGGRTGWSARSRRWVGRRVAEALSGRSGPASSLVRMFALGDRRAVDLATVQGLRRLGLSHLLAVSGLHVGLVALLGLGLPLPRRGRHLAALCGVSAYLWLVGARPSLLRAVAMAWLAGSALILGRVPAGLNALAWAGMIMVAVDPAVVGDVGFQLSFAATAGILLFASGLAARWRALPPWLAAPLAVTVVAQVAALPWSASRFHFIAVLAPLANLVAVPWMAVVLAGSLLFVVLAVPAPSAARLLYPLLSAISAPITWPARLPAALTPILPVGWSLPLAGGIAVAALVCIWWARPWSLGGLLVVVVAATLGRPHSRVPPSLTVWDVGQGESVLLRDGSHEVLVDGGGWRHGDFGGYVLLPALAHAGVRRIDAMVMTHADVDHCGGLVDLARYLPVRRLYAAAAQPRAPCWEALRGVPGLRVTRLRPGETVLVGRWRLHILGPAARRLRGNDRSLVIRASLEGWSALLPGDIEAAGERALVRRWGPHVLRSDLLIVPHHGSRSSSSEVLLTAVKPRLGVISVGRHNPYGHPAPVVLSRLRRHAVPVLRTDRDGMVRITPRPEPVRIDLPGSPREEAPRR